VNNTPITHAIDSGATEVWVLSTGYSCGLAKAPRGAVAMAMHSVALLVQQRLVLETASRHYDVLVHLIPPPCPISVTPIDFSRTAQLIERAHAGTRQWLNNGCPHAMPLTLHHAHHELSAS
jgi:NTE family protein